MKALTLAAVLMALASTSNAEPAQAAPALLQTSGAQKICTIRVRGVNFEVLEYDTYPAPASWTIYTCAVSAQRVANQLGVPWNLVDYRVECLFDTADPNAASSRGTMTYCGTMASPPPVNCGW